MAGVGDASLYEQVGQTSTEGHVDERECNGEGEPGIGQNVFIDEDHSCTQEHPEGNVPAPTNPVSCKHGQDRQLPPPRRTHP